MAYRGRERRKYERYDMETKVHFYVTYSVKTRVRFRIFGSPKFKAFSDPYIGITRNISAEGLRFSSNVRLQRGNLLFIELFLPGSLKAIPMTGQVRWSKQVLPRLPKLYRFDTGVKLVSLKRKPVRPSIHFEEHKQVHWSVVLDSVFGGFRKFLQKARRRHIPIKKRIKEAQAKANKVIKEH
jgi:hypothetical protein